MLPTHYNPRHKPGRAGGVTWQSFLMSKWTISAAVIIVYFLTCLHYSNAVYAGELQIDRLQRLSDASKAELQIKIETLEKRDQLMAQLQKQHDDNRLQVTDMTRRVNGLEAQLKDQLAKFETEKASLQGRSTDDKAQLQQLNAQLERSLSSSIESFKSLQSTLNASRASGDSCRDSLKTKVNSFESTIVSLRTQLDEHSRSLRSLRAQLVKCQAGQHDQHANTDNAVPEDTTTFEETLAAPTPPDATITPVEPDNIIIRDEHNAPTHTTAPPPIDIDTSASALTTNDNHVDGHIRTQESTAAHLLPLNENKETSAILAEFASDTSAEARRYWIKREFRHAWKGYTSAAWGQDELKPISHVGHENFGMGLTLVDSLDTIIIMGLETEYQQCLEWVRESLHFGDQEGINVFEVTIRILGGLLAAYNLKQEQLFLDRATDLADQMLFAFESPTGLPYGTIGLKTKSKFNPSWSGGASTVAEVGSIQLEWQYLSRVTGNPVYAQKVDHITDRLKDLNKSLYSQFISVEKGHMTSSVITFGARVDSLYEYFLKQHILSGYKKPDALKLYTDSMTAMINQLLVKSTPNGYTFVSELHDDKNVGKMDHLVCFVPGMLALGANHSVVDEPIRSHHMTFARELMRTCYEFYRQSPTGLSPEIVQFTSDPLKDFVVDAHAAHSLLRPETVESLFVLWRTTHDPIYRQWGWNIFEAFVRYCRIPGGGYSGLRDVRVTNIDSDGNGTPSEWSNWSDKMESFWLAETLKYLYLLFEDDHVISLNDFVFNTEAHPLPIDKHR